MFPPEKVDVDVVQGEGLIGEYTIVKGQPIHVLLIRESGWGA